MKYDEDGYIICEDCLCHYTAGYGHQCPPWLKELVKMKRDKDLSTNPPSGLK